MATISIFGKGNMGNVIAQRFEQAGNQVSFVARNDNPASLGDIVVLAVPYAEIATICDKFATQLIGKIVVDISNPVDFATMDSLLVPADSSATAEIAKKLPQAQVLKAFNTNFAATLAEGNVGNETATVLVAGDSESAKTVFSQALNGSGLNVKDAGSLKRVRELEAMGFLQITLAIREQVSWTGGFAVVA